MLLRKAKHATLELGKSIHNLTETLTAPVSERFALKISTRLVNSILVRHDCLVWPNEAFKYDNRLHIANNSVVKMAHINVQYLPFEVCMHFNCNFIHCNKKSVKFNL